MHRMVLVVLFASLWGCASRPEPAVAPAPLTAEILENATFFPRHAEGRRIRLAGGRFQDADKKLEIALDGPAAFEDLNGDGAGDAAICLATSTGGDESYKSLEVVLNQHGVPRHAASAELGDRVVIQKLVADPPVIRIDLLEHKPGDQPCCPTSLARRYFQFVGNRLLELPRVPPER